MIDANGLHVLSSGNSRMRLNGSGMWLDHFSSYTSGAPPQPTEFGEPPASSPLAATSIFADRNGSPMFRIYASEKQYELEGGPSPDQNYYYLDGVIEVPDIAAPADTGADEVWGWHQRLWLRVAGNDVVIGTSGTSFDNDIAVEDAITAGGSVTASGLISGSGGLNISGGTIEFDPGNGSTLSRALNFNIGGANYGKILIPSGSGGAMAFYAGTINAAAERMRITTDGDMGIGATAPGGRLHVAQSSTTRGIPSMVVQQADLSEEIIQFDTTVGAGNPVDTAALGTYYGKLRVSVNGIFKYIPLYNT
jgi:hypothetical protein